MAYVSIVKADNKYYLLAVKDGAAWNVRGFESQNDGLRYYEDGYQRAHGRGYEGSMSACINFISFHPSICEIDNVEDLRPLLDGDRVVHVSNVSGRMDGIPLKEEAQAVWEAGKKPDLIKESML